MTHSPYNFVNLKQVSSHMVRMAQNIRIGHVFQQLVEPVATLVVPAMVSREKGDQHYTSSTLSMELFDNVNRPCCLERP